MKASHSLCRALALSALLCAVGTRGAVSQEEKPLRDYWARGEIVLKGDVVLGLPDGDAGPVQNTPRARAETGFVVQMLQGYVAPDRYGLLWNVMGSEQTLIFQGDVEYDWMPARGFLVRTHFRNIRKAKEHPSQAYKQSLHTMRMVMKGVKSIGDVDPAQALRKPAVLEAERTRIKKLRDELVARAKQEGVSKEVYDRITLEASQAGELLAEVVTDLKFLELQRAYPCVVREYDNTVVLQALNRIGQVGPSAYPALAKGKTRIWFTRDYGLPVRFELRDSRQKTILRSVFTQLKVNSGLTPDQLSSGAPKQARMLTISVNLSKSNWERDLNGQIAKASRDLLKYTVPVSRRKPPIQLRGTKRKKIKRPQK